MQPLTERKEQKQPVSRRDWLKATWVTLGGLAALEIGAAAVAYTQPRLAEGEFGGIVNAGKVEDYPPGTVTHISKGRFYLTRRADGGFLALHQRCTHLGCSVPWDQTQNLFVCPCHNSQFNADGELLSPPAPSPLNLFRVSIQDGEILVDTGQPMPRQRFEVSQAVYP